MGDSPNWVQTYNWYRITSVPPKPNQDPSSLSPASLRQTNTGYQRSARHYPRPKIKESESGKDHSGCPTGGPAHCLAATLKSPFCPLWGSLWATSPRGAPGLVRLPTWGRPSPPISRPKRLRHLFRPGASAGKTSGPPGGGLSCCRTPRTGWHRTGCKARTPKRAARSNA